MLQENLIRMYEESFRTHRELPALTDYFKGETFSYYEMAKEIAKLHLFFKKAEIRRGDKIALVGRNNPRWCITYLATITYGAVIVPILQDFAPADIVHIVNHSESRLLFVGDNYWDIIEEDEIARIDAVLSLTDFHVIYERRGKSLGVYMRDMVKNYRAKYKRGFSADDIKYPDIPNDQMVLLNYTSGTTGYSKGVMLTDDCFNGIALQFQAYPKLFHRGQKLMNVMPPFIAYGFACGIHLPLVLGFTVIIIPNLDPAKLGSLVLKYKPEHMFGVPAHYQQLAADPKLRDKDLSFILNYAAGGDSLSLGAEQTVNQFLKAHGVEFPLAKGYGMTEVSSAATIAAGNVTKPGSVGIPMVNTVVSIFEPGTETELPIGQRGEICICTPTAMKGYYNKPEETAYLLRRHADGQLWAHTGDIGSMDEDGFVYLDARIKRIIIRHDGFKVFPSMIENVISRHPAVQQCCVVGCADTDHTQGRLPFVFVVLDPAAAGKKRQILRELRQLCREELPEYVQPASSAYKVIAEMPMTPAGKADYRKLEEELG